MDFWVRVVVVDVPKSSAVSTPNKDHLGSAAQISQAAAALLMMNPATASPNSSSALGSNTVSTMVIYLEQTNIDEKWQLSMLAQ